MLVVVIRVYIDRYERCLVYIIVYDIRIKININRRSVYHIRIYVVVELIYIIKQRFQFCNEIHIAMFVCVVEYQIERTVRSYSDMTVVCGIHDIRHTYRRIGFCDNFMQVVVVYTNIHLTTFDVYILLERIV